jgi:hypothetical protein
MSQRRGGGSSKEEMIPFTESLEEPNDLETQTTTTVESLSIERDEREMRIKQWREGPFAATMTLSWEEEKTKYDRNFFQTCFQNVDANDGMPCICCSVFGKTVQIIVRMVSFFWKLTVLVYFFVSQHAVRSVQEELGE